MQSSTGPGAGSDLDSASELPNLVRQATVEAVSKWRDANDVSIAPNGVWWFHVEPPDEVQETHTFTGEKRT